MVDITNPIFHDEAKADAHLEASRWPQGPFCPSAVRSTCTAWPAKLRLACSFATTAATSLRLASAALWSARHIPVHKWLLAMHLMAASKKGMSSKQLQRMLGVSYKSAWFLVHAHPRGHARRRRRPIGGEGKVIESDETFVGGKKKNVHKGKPEPKKHAVHALVERGGRVRAKHVADVTAKTLQEEPRELADRKSALHTDDSLGEPFHRQGLRGAPDGRSHVGRVRHKDDAAHADGRELLCDPKARRLWLIPLRSASSTSSATLTSSPSAGTTARLLGSRTLSAPPNCSRLSLVSDLTYRPTDERVEPRQADPPA